MVNLELNNLYRRMNMTEDQIEWLKENIQLTINKKHGMYAEEYLLIELAIAGDVIFSHYVDIKE